MRRPFYAFVTGSLIASIGCTGSIVDRRAALEGNANGGAPLAGAGAIAGAAGVSQAGEGGDGSALCESGSRRRVRRLSTREYLNVVTDLLGAELASVARPMLPVEPDVAGFDNQDSALLVSSAFHEALTNVAEELSTRVEVPAIAPCADAAGSAQCLESFAGAFARKAYGRSPTPDELADVLAVAALGEGYEGSVRLVVELVLQSPHTLYATELGPESAPTTEPAMLTQQEIATQLALLLTAARPDEALMSAAENELLADPAELTRHVERLLATERGEEQLRAFIKGWLDLGAVADAPKHPDAFPELTAEVIAAMQVELDAFITQEVAQGDGTLHALLTATSRSVPEALETIYGDELTQGVLDPTHRRGVLSLPGFLAYHSADQHSGPIERGLLVRRQLLCQDIPPPPASVLQQITEHPIDSNDMQRTTRQKYEQHKTETSCASCHQHFDVIGFGMEDMDAIGRFRTTENGLPIDASGELNATDVDGPFTGTAELATTLADSTSISDCFVRQFFRFAAARPATVDEHCVVKSWADAFEQGGGRIGDLITTYVTDPGFATRRGEP